MLGNFYRIFIYFHVYLILNKLIRDSLKHVSKIEFKEKQRIEYLQYMQRNYRVLPLVSLTLVSFLLQSIIKKLNQSSIFFTIFQCILRTTQNSVGNSQHMRQIQREEEKITKRLRKGLVFRENIKLSENLTCDLSLVSEIFSLSTPFIDSIRPFNLIKKSIK